MFIVFWKDNCCSYYWSCKTTSSGFIATRFRKCPVNGDPCRCKPPHSNHLVQECDEGCDDRPKAILNVALFCTSRYIQIRVLYVKQRSRPLALRLFHKRSILQRPESMG